jgi:signal transduction histidine kinase
MVRRALVPIVGLALAVGFCLGEALLQRQLTKAKSAELTLVRVENQVNQLQGIPWNIENPSFGTPRFVRGLMARTERSVLTTVASLERTAPNHNVRAAVAPLRANFRALDNIYALGLARGGWNDPRSRSTVALAQNKTVDATSKQLKAAEERYATAARSANAMVTYGGAAGTMILFGAFLVFYLRFTAASARQRRTLDDLEQAQHDRSRLLERTVEVAEHERIRLAVDLHDGPIQHLTALAFNIDRLGRRVAKGDLDGAQELAEDVRTSLSAEMHALRQLMVELRPPILDEGGLAAAVGDAATRLLGDTSTAWGVSSDLDEHLAPELETVVYRVANEALTNVRKHAQASRVDVVITRTLGGDLSLTITDDGRGFDPARVEHQANGRHYGLLGMNERVAGLGGVCRVVSRPRIGTSVRVTLPLKTRSGRSDEKEKRDLVAA